MDGEYELTEVQQEISDGLRFFLKAFGAKRFQNGVQLEAATTLITLYGIETFKQGVTWAATVGMSRGRALLALQKALPKWGGNKRADAVNKYMRQDEESRQRYKEWETLNSSVERERRA